MIRLTVALALPVAVVGAAETTRNLVAAIAVQAGQEGKPAGWTTWSPRTELAPESKVVTGEGGAVLEVRASRFEQYGQWTTRVEGVVPGKVYQFEALYRTEGVESEPVSVVALLTWQRGPGDAGEIQRDYAEVAGTEGAWRRVVRTIEAPAGTTGVKLHLGLRWTKSGSVRWRDVRLTEVAPPPVRKVRIATTYVRPVGKPPTVAGNKQLMADVMDAVGKERPDVVLFSENLSARSTRLPLAEKAEPIPGPLTDMLGEKARQYRTYVATTLHERDGACYYNTAVLIDREGRLVGKYRKVHLAMEEADVGITPGSEYPVFDTDFGRVGLLTCWDNWFSETARLLRLKGATILLWPTAGDGAPDHAQAIARARAMDNGVYLVASATVMPHQSVIINPQGELLAEATEAGRYALAEIDLNQAWRLRYLSVGSGTGEARSLYVKERRPDTYGELMAGERGAAKGAK